MTEDTTLADKLQQSIDEVKARKNGAAAAGTATAPVTNSGANQNAQHPQNSRTNAPVIQFRKATKTGSKLRMAICGPSGSGKTYTLLQIATELGGKIAMVDTEHGSASKYADLFDFDVFELDNFDPAMISQIIRAAHAQGYASLVIDSLSHFWNGQNGELDQVDKITARMKSANSFAAWREVSPKHNQMLDAMIAAPIHILVSMRVKTEWVLEKDERGKTAPRKVGLQPVMRDGIEYEFDVCGDMDQENTLIVTKSRCPQLAGGVYRKPGADVAVVLKSWLAPAPKPPQSAETVASQPNFQKPWKTFREMIACFADLREAAGETSYFAALEKFGVKEASEFKSTNEACQAYAYLLGVIAEGKAVA